MHINFGENKWDESQIAHAYTYRFPVANRFVQRENWVENGENPAMADGYDYLSLVTRQKYPLGTKITTRCAFFGKAAPLLILADTLDLCQDGAFRYGNYFEVVLYQKGINVWRLWQKEDGTVTWHKLLGVEFPVAEGEIHTLSAELKENYILADLNGMKFTLRADGLFPEFHLGITGCEGICRFYDMTVE